MLDGALGTRLEERGLARGPLWSARALLVAPAAVREAHAAETAAGAEILTANTFRTHERTVARASIPESADSLTRIAVALAREVAAVAGRAVAVFGSLSPLEDCYRPDLVPDDEDLAREHGAQARAILEAGADGILVETHNSIRELVAATRAARATGLPVVASMVTDGNGRLLSGEPIGDAARALEPLAPDALAINCVPWKLLAGDLRVLAAAAPGRRLGAWGNLGRPGRHGYEEAASPEQYAERAAEWAAIGARLIGGCCGTTPAHTAAVRDTLMPGAPRPA
ncbi:MAG: homocysteine S-methyltransferase family protein [Acidobacteriota bacterium]